MNQTPIVSSNGTQGTLKRFAWGTAECRNLVARAESRSQAQALALRVVADSFEQGEAGPTFSAFRSKLHERLAKHTDPTVVDFSPANRLASKAADRVAPCAGQREIARFRFAFQDGEEASLRILARIVKKTGLRPEDP